MRKNSPFILTLVTALMLTACGGETPSQSTDTPPVATNVDIADVTYSASEAVVQTFCVSDFIAEPDNRITKAMGGRAYKLMEIPDFPDADKQFHPSTEDYCLMCYPTTVYLETIESEMHIAKFDLISYDLDGMVDSHYQAFVFNSAEEAEKYHELERRATV